MNTKIGVGIVTCNRSEFFKQCVNSIPNVDTLIVVNDGTPYDSNVYPSTVKEIIQHNTNKCVGISKNEIMRYLVQDKCQFIFLMEDDIFIKNPNVFEQYIKTGEVFGTWHLNYALPGGSYNVHPQTGQYIIRKVIEDDESGMELYLYPNCTGALSFYQRGIIKQVGYMDERYKNAMEHVDHTYKIIKAGLHPPFWWFADIAKSWEYIGNITKSDEGSEIRKDKTQWQKNFNEACAWFRHKHGYIPQQVPQTEESEVFRVLSNIQTNFARKVQ
jgi:glycosyltransferase involved in cell wall biosynthesis